MKLIDIIKVVAIGAIVLVTTGNSKDYYRYGGGHLYMGDKKSPHPANMYGDLKSEGFTNYWRLHGIKNKGDVSNSYSHSEGSGRQGFVIGLGAGVGSLSLENGGYGGLGLSNDFDEFGFATSFEIGYAFTNQFSLNYINNVTWASGDSIYGFDTNIGGLSGISANYYINDAPETFYVMGGIGLTTFANWDSGNGDTGIGILLGGGYAMEHIEFEADVIFGGIDTSFGDTRDMFMFQATVSYLYY